MVLSIEIAAQTEARLREQAKAAGTDIDTYVAQLVENAAARPAFDEMLDSHRKQFEATGITDEELISDITKAQSDYRSEKTKKPA